MSRLAWADNVTGNAIRPVPRRDRRGTGFFSSASPIWSTAKQPEPQGPGFTTSVPSSREMQRDSWIWPQIQTSGLYSAISAANSPLPTWFSPRRSAFVPYGGEWVTTMSGRRTRFASAARSCAARASRSSGSLLSKLVRPARRNPPPRPRQRGERQLAQSAFEIAVSGGEAAAYSERIAIACDCGGMKRKTRRV